MNDRRVATRLLAVLFACSACVPPGMPPRQDPFASVGAERASASFPELSVALVSSANTKETVAWGHRMLAGGATQKWLKDELEYFKTKFGRVVTAESIPAAWAGGVDLVIVYDVYEQTARSCKYDETLVLLSPDGREIERIKGDTDVPFGNNPFNTNKVLARCMAEVRAEIDHGIAGSAALRALADRKRIVPAAAAPSPGLPDILRPSFKRDADESAFALVVGVERYARIPQADFAERDAQAVRDHLSALGVPQRNIIYLAGSEASYSSLKKYLESWLPKNVKPASRVFFYFSGHGAPDTASGEAYLLPWDGDPAFLKDTAYPTKRLYEQLAALPAEAVIVAMDACFSGGGGRSVLAKGARPLVVKVETGAVAAANMTVFSAATAEQITSTLEEKGHGMFTYFFLKGLGGEARDGSGAVTAKGLYDYLKPKVQDAARRQNRDQDPVLHTQSDRKLVRF